MLVTSEPVDERFGRLLSTHPVAGGRYWSTGLKALAFGLGGVLLMAVLIARPDFVVGKLLGLAVIPTIAGLPIAALQLTRALRGGRGETYELYENGLAHRRPGRVRSWTWEQVAVVRADRDAAGEAPAEIPYVRLSRSLGRNFRCAVRFTDGSRIRIDGYTADGPVIARTLLARRPDAVPVKSARKGPLIWLGTLPLVGAAFAVPLVVMFRHLNSTGADDTGDGVIVAMALGMIVCAVGVALAFGGFVAALLSLSRTRQGGAGPRQDGGQDPV
ncbi:hypothetical protein [Streptomyces sp. NPDC001658]